MSQWTTFEFCLEMPKHRHLSAKTLVGNALRKQDHHVTLQPEKDHTIVRVMLEQSDDLAFSLITNVRKELRAAGVSGGIIITQLLVSV